MRHHGPIHGTRVDHKGMPPPRLKAVNWIAFSELELRESVSMPVLSRPERFVPRVCRPFVFPARNSFVLCFRWCFFGSVFCFRRFSFGGGLWRLSFGSSLWRFGIGGGLCCFSFVRNLD